MDTKQKVPLALIDGDGCEQEMQLITFNLRGSVFQLESETLSRLPVKSRFNTTLESRYGISLDNLPTHTLTCDQIYLNRNPQLFNCILDYTETSQLHFPHNTCSELIRSEMQFWGVAEKALAQCCYERLAAEARVAEHQQRVARKWRWLENSRKLVEKELPCGTVSFKMPIREHVRLFFEDCGSSVFAKAWGVFLTFIIVMSLATLILETQHSLRHPPYDDVIATCNLSKGEGLYEYYTVNSVAAPWVSWIDFSCLCILSADYLIRFLVSYRKCLFLLHPLNITDLLGILPMWVLFGVHRYRTDAGDLFSDSVEKTITFLAIMRLFRILRFVRIMTYSKQLKIIYIAVMACYREIIILTSLMGMLSIVFGSAIYYAELKVDNFESILIGQWWAIVTMTTVGYGDYYPKTQIGYLLGVLCSLTGIIHIALATTVIVNNFIITADGVEKSIRQKKRTDTTDPEQSLWPSKSAINSHTSDTKNGTKV